MGLKKIISVSGMPGLYKVLAQTKSGFIVESLADQKRSHVASTQRISMLEDISVFTKTDDLPLKDVLLRMKEYSAGNMITDPKSDPAELRSFFKNVITDFDEDRVYPSDIKKIIIWFHLVKDDIEKEDEPEVAETIDEKPAEESANNETVEAPVEKETVKKKSTKKSTSKKQ